MSEFVEISTSTRRREEESRRILDRASPVIVWPAEEGILVIATNRDKRENRIHSIYDRIACVTLGTFSGGTILWQHAAFRASSDGFNLSKGDVSCRIIIRDTSALLSESFHGLRKGPLFGVEAIFVEVDEERESDYLAYLNFMGFVNTFDQARLFGRLDPDVDRNGDRDELKDSAERKLSEIWDPTRSLSDVIEILNREELFRGIFTSSRVEIVTMDRSAVKKGEFNRVFKRTA
ncbi:MAG: hypothetical protein A2655_04655 [Candidatus Yanofskybacteria bacterium RIFCSPHIGHO2_01_FULL_43_42]|uniref:Uncharacterized protein n=1 Tax=Candidatus Yanofskybacteria bacterium RIFCSPLOWO2_01_FULL_43_22 TaxID=1802695 RepID=A0A1F8GHE1_9BACT|nr:MAG: hypothetical protein A2655_04655 [Candidatus Yanofskybacteria bacterium RIFCSPHIGHO2_01_FULL_43_42]OGN12806.1 MAG: hypothetical protein A3D48_00980 [Candidatus Yanofskybacteria bacterium RIFCSPHIGHO2_02_FULL_43_17]OGN23859.1 MAG: hypothetical protein A3A13_02090 [Candidatus Yanofskybacteria bacterium RIFCSPLOWO2_01_FULL_43_22]